MGSGVNDCLGAAIKKPAGERVNNELHRQLYDSLSAINRVNLF
jgi:hypothetical protein